MQQPLGGELALTAELAHFLLGQPIAPPHHFGIDTFLTVNTVLGGFPVVEVYLTQKTHNKKGFTELRGMVLECFDELCKQIAFHGRHRRMPVEVEKGTLVTALSKERAPERIGEDVRTLQYVNLDEQLEHCFTFVRGLGELLEARLGELGVSEAEQALVLALCDEDEEGFHKRSAELNARRWVPLVDQLARGYIERGFSPVYHDAIFVCWQLRALSFALHEAQNFEAAEENTDGQARYAYEYGARYRL
ncbi:MAG: hypothetical protein ACE5JP_12330 [Candidatus Bipolaricaulia bacterium]